MSELWAGKTLTEFYDVVAERVCHDVCFFFVFSGEFGRYQWTQYVFQMLPAFLGGVHMLSQVEVGATPKHRFCLAS